MLTLPKDYCTLISTFEYIFSKRVWRHVQVLVVGAILAPGKRTVTSVLRVMGLSDEVHYQNYHRVLNRARWSSLEVSRLLLMLLINRFVPTGPIVLGLYDTIERRRGAQIKAKGICRDSVRLSQSHFVRASELRRLSLKDTILAGDIFWSNQGHSSQTPGIDSASVHIQRGFRLSAWQFRRSTWSAVRHRDQ